MPETLVLRVQSKLIENTEEIPGLLNPQLLSSTLARPQHLFYYGVGVTLFDLAAAYGYGFAKNHCFFSANKRIALAVVYIFLELNGYRLIAPKEKLFNCIVALAESRIDQEFLANWLSLNSCPL